MTLGLNPRMEFGPKMVTHVLVCRPSTSSRPPRPNIKPPHAVQATRAVLMLGGGREGSEFLAQFGVPYEG